MAVVQRYYYGAKPDKPDDRDYKKKYEQHEIPCMWTHPNVDLSGYVYRVYDQGDLGSCTANALCAAYGLDLVKQSQTTRGGYDYFDPSRLFLYYNTREREGNESEDSGASIRDAVKSMNCKGVCKESDWPYTVRRFKEKPPQLCYDAAVGNNLCKYKRLDQDIDQFRACLKDKCPFVFGFNVYKSFRDISKHKYTVQMPRSDERDYGSFGRHAVVAVGYNDTKSCIKVLNSWSSDWGDNGYFYMPYQFISNSFFCFDFWKISFACERGKPRPNDIVRYAGISGSSGIVSHPLPYISRVSDFDASGYFPPSRVISKASGRDSVLHLPSIHSGGASGYGRHPTHSRVNRSGRCDLYGSYSYMYPPQSRFNRRANGYDSFGAYDECSHKRYSSDYRRWY